jgi:hypothetical protein
MDLIVTEEILEVIKGKVSLNEAVVAMLPFDTNKGTQQIPMMLNVPLKNNYITPLGIQMLQTLNICIESEIDKNAKSVRLGHIWGDIYFHSNIRWRFFHEKGWKTRKYNADDKQRYWEDQWE